MSLWGVVLGTCWVVVFLPRWALILEDSSAFVCLQATFPQLSAPFKASHLQGWLPLQRTQKDLTWKCFLKDRKGNWPRKFHPSSSWTNLCLVLLALLLSSPAFGVKAFWCYLYKWNSIRVTFLLHSLKGDWTITLKIVTFRWELY